MKDMELFSDFFVIFVYFVVNFSPCFFVVSSYEKLEMQTANIIKEKIKNILNWLNNKESLHVDIKKLTGKWKGFYRLRIGRIRVLLTQQFSVNNAVKYDIDAFSTHYSRQRETSVSFYVPNREHRLLS